MVGRALLLLALVPLGACRQSEPDVQATNASVEDVANQVRAASESERFIQPGKWLSTVKFEQMSAPGVPEGTADRMNEMLGQNQTFESCLSDEEAKRPSEQFFAGKDNQCRYENFTMGDGKIDATMRCSAGAGEQVMRMEGSYSPDSYSLRMTSAVEGAAGVAGTLKMQMRIDAKRVGECDTPPAG